MTTPEHDPFHDPPRGPDLTEPVMRRLGLAGVTPGKAKRRRRRRASLRAALCVVVVGAGGLVVMLVSSQPQPLAPTVPSAIRHDLQQHGRTIDRVAATEKVVAKSRNPASPTATATAWVILVRSPTARRKTFIARTATTTACLTAAK